MNLINVESIQHAVNAGTLVELASDYRTSRTVKACLPKQPAYAFAISSTAFRRHLEGGTPGQRQLRMEAVCAFLCKVLGLSGTPTSRDLEFNFPEGVGQTETCALKLHWYEANHYWVLLLPDEQLRPQLRLA